MADVVPMNAGSIIGRIARSLVSQVSEFVHVSVVYLGIALLVTVALAIGVPSLKTQTEQMHAALLSSLRPAELQATPAREPYAMTSVDPDFTSALRDADGVAIPGATPAQAQTLRSYIARKYRIAHDVAAVIIRAAFAEAAELKLDPQLVLAVIAIESRYNPFAESHVGAQGLMQVMPGVHKDKFEVFALGQTAALDPLANIRVGSRILYDCIRRRGSVEGGLACYVGATGPTDGGYGAKVLAERRRIALASGIPVRRD